jgi:hypothetical protein
MARIFLSYSRQDANSNAKALRAQLESSGHIVWRDIEDMQGGLSWKKQIRDQIQKAHCVIVLLTPKGIESENVEYEWQTGLSFDQRVIPLLIKKCPIPPALKDLHYHIATDQQAYDQMFYALIRDLNAIDKQLAQSSKRQQKLSPELQAYIQQATTAYITHLKEMVQVATSHVPLEPYKQLYAFELSDEQIFFGRDTDSKQLQRVILRDRLAVLHARSGAGKTSLVNAGLMPRLITAGYVPIYARSHLDPIKSIKNTITAQLAEDPPEGLANLSLQQFLHIAQKALGSTSIAFVVILDQFEEFFVLYPEEKQRQRFIDALADCYEDHTLRTRFLLSLRKDYFSDLGEFQMRLGNIYHNEVRLKNLTRDQAQAAIVDPVQTVDSNITYEPDLLEELLSDLETSGMELPHLQIICSQLYAERNENQSVITLDDYIAFGRAQGILGNYLSKTLDRLPAEEHNIARRLLVELVSSQSTKRILPRENLLAIVEAPAEQVDAILRQLVNDRLLRVDKDTDNRQVLYEMAHEYLVDEISRWFDTELMAVKQMQELLQRAAINWRTHRILMDTSMQERIFQERENLGSLTDETYNCILLSSVKELYQVEYWVQRDSQRALRMLEAAINDNQLSRKLRSRAVVSLRFLHVK